MDIITNTKENPLSARVLVMWGKLRIGALALLVAGLAVFMNYSEDAKKMVDQHLVQGDLLRTLATYVDIDRQTLLDGTRSNAEIADKLIIVRDILLYIDRYAKLQPRAEAAI